jgi:hypothetical protein
METIRINESAFEESRSEPIQISNFRFNKPLKAVATLHTNPSGRRECFLLPALTRVINMAAQSARLAVVLYSLAITGFLIVFLVLAQPLGMRFDFGKEENLRLVDIVLPTFFGYLGAASHFLFNANRGRDIEAQNETMLKVLIHGPFLIFIAAVSSLFFAHYVSHRPLESAEPRIDQMDFGTVSRYLSICLALLAATVGVISSYLFGAPATPANAPNEATKN